MLKMTQSLLSSWLYYINANDERTEGAYEGFMQTLIKQPKERTKAMQKGVDFENEINRIVAGGEFDKERDDFMCVVEIALQVQGGIPQCYAEKMISINGYDVKLYGYLDYLKAGTIYDIKRTSSYEYGKYQHSPQHPVYFEIVEGAKAFEYLVCDGKRVYKEVYNRNDGSYETAETIIENFFNWLNDNQLFEIYKEKWSL